ncbi:O-antigen ligase [Flavobacterium sp. DG2-3]|uniref:O-antigen ligase family protein n=1 Tax=Flavobacterium sp. DG2-3 TaxID=3068317 RepID=UPI00273F3DC2|nr:O-antigen ligase family protein [Flavobacterium sp. DG2-3]MDP5198408.1 O-antigen ligase family protein [Flavobacterium sp. DG2-3]
MKETQINKIIVYFLYLLAFASCFYMFEAIQAIIMSAASFFLLLQYTSKKKLLSIKTLPFILSFLLLLIYNLFYFNSRSLQSISNSLLIFVVPIFSLFLYDSSFFKKHKNNILLSYSCCISILSIYILGFYINDIPNHHFNWYFARFNLEKNIHIHGTYISLWIAVALLFVFDFLAKNKDLHAKFKISLLILAFLLLASMVVINARMILFSTLILIALNAYFLFVKQGLFNKKIILIPLVLLFTGVIFLSQRYKDDLKFLNKNKIENSSRYTICYCSLKVIRNSNFLGTDNSTIQPKLNDCYDEYGFEDLSKEKLNSHNQYLDYFMKGGILLFIAFIVTLFVKLRYALKSKNYLYFSISLLFTFSFLTENILVRQYGIYLFLFCDILFLGSVLINESHCTDEIEKN